MGAVAALCPAGTPPPFFNVNTPDDLLQAAAWLE
jgi:molybdopterin-guanine dinucleotide biosynthesis protein A